MRQQTIVHYFGCSTKIEDCSGIFVANGAAAAAFVAYFENSYELASPWFVHPTMDAWRKELGWFLVVSGRILDELKVSSEVEHLKVEFVIAK